MICASAAHGNRSAPDVSSRRDSGGPMTSGETDVAALIIQETRDVAPITDLDLSHAVRSDACVLFTGDHETAEALARRLHALSGWRHGPFVTVDCASSDAEPRLLRLLEVEKPEALNGTSWPTLAQSGTVFLREVGELDPSEQIRLSERLAALRTRKGIQRSIRRRVISSS